MQLRNPTLRKPLNTKAKDDKSRKIKVLRDFLFIFPGICKTHKAPFGQRPVNIVQQERSAPLPRAGTGAVLQQDHGLPSAEDAGMDKLQKNEGCTLFPRLRQEEFMQRLML